MQKLAVLLLILIYSQASFSDDFVPFARGLHIKIEAFKRAQSYRSCAYYGNRTTAQEDFQQFSIDPGNRATCVAKICPTFDKIAERKFEENVFNSKNKFLDSQLTSVKEALKDMINATSKYSEAKSRWSEKILDKSLPITPGLGLAALNTFISSFVSVNLKQNVLNNKMGLDESDRKSMQKILTPIFGKTDGEAVVELFSKISQEPRVAVIALSDFGAPNRYKRQYPNLSYQDAVKKDLVEAQEALKNAPAELKRIFQLAGLDQEIEKKIKKTNDKSLPIDELEGQDIMRVTDSVQQLVAISKHTKSDPQLAVRIAKVLVDSKRSGSSQNEKIKVLPALAAGFEKKKLLDMANVFSGSERLYQNCLFQIANSFLTLPSEEQNKNFTAQLPEMRNQIKAAIKNKYSHVSGKILNDIVDTVSVYSPPSKEKYLENVLEQLKSKINRTNIIRETGDRNISDAAIIGSLGDQSMTDQAEIEKTCKNLSFHPVRDNTISLLGGISAGSDCVKHKDFGIGILAHELGHNFMHTLNSDKRISQESREKQKKVESCLVGLHTGFFEKLKKHNQNQPSDKQDKRKDDHYVSEDYSDVIGAITAQGANFWCEFQPDGSAWSPLDATDPHSSDLFRLIHIETASGRTLPQECVQFLKSNNYELKGCL